jgi:multidrug efflux pump subunit AcrB
MLIGLVTKNGILIVEFANQIQVEDESISKMDAIMKASVSRLRPILMTSLTIALGALPIALSIGAASTSRIGMGVVIIGGTMFSLILTLYVIPALYLMWSRKKVLRPEFKNLELSEHGR